MIEEKLVSILQGTGVPIYPLFAPENSAYPCIVYQRISTVPIRSHAGPVMDRPRFQFSIWSRNYEQCVNVAAAIRTVLDLNRVDVKLATRENEFEVVEVEPGLYRKLLDFFVWHIEGV